MATLCLLECSATGLLETELLEILGDEDNLTPEDKGEDKGAEKGEFKLRDSLTFNKNWRRGQELKYIYHFLQNAFEVVRVSLHIYIKLISDDSSREKSRKDIGSLPFYKWAEVYRALRLFLRPFGDSGEGRLDFYHRSLSKAVRIRYACQSSCLSVCH